MSRHLSFLFLCTTLILLFPQDVLSQVASRPLTENDRFIRLINLVEPRMTKRWKTGADLIKNQAVMFADTRSREATPYMYFLKQDLATPLEIQLRNFPQKRVVVELKDELLDSDFFFTVILSGIASDQGQQISSRVLADKISSESGAIIRVISGISSYPISIKLNAKTYSLKTSSDIQDVLTPGSHTCELLWTSKELGQRKLPYQFSVQAGIAYSLIVSDTGEGDSSPTIGFFSDTEIAKDAVLAAFPPKEETP